MRDLSDHASTFRPAEHVDAARAAAGPTTALRQAFEFADANAPIASHPQVGRINDGRSYDVEELRRLAIKHRGDGDALARVVIALRAELAEAKQRIAALGQLLDDSEKARHGHYVRAMENGVDLSTARARIAERTASGMPIIDEADADRVVFKDHQPKILPRWLAPPPMPEADRARLMANGQTVAGSFPMSRAEAVAELGWEEGDVALTPLGSAPAGIVVHASGGVAMSDLKVYPDAESFVADAGPDRHADEDDGA